MLTVIENFFFFTLRYMQMIYIESAKIFLKYEIEKITVYLLLLYPNKNREFLPS